MRVQFKKLSEHARTPTRGTEYSAGYDVYAAENVVIKARGWSLIRTNIALGWPDHSYYVQVASRSGLCYKNGLFATAGVIDYDYRKDIGVILMNGSDIDFEIKIGDRMAQLLFIRVENNIEFEETEEFEEINSSRNGGFGSTGLNENLKEEK